MAYINVTHILTNCLLFLVLSNTQQDILTDYLCMPILWVYIYNVMILKGLIELISVFFSPENVNAKSPFLCVCIVDTKHAHNNIVIC